MIATFVLASTTFYILLYNDVFHFAANWQHFLLTQKFYAMAIGAVFAYILYFHFNRYEKSLFSKLYIQFIVLLIITGHYLTGFGFSENLYFKILLAFLYGLLILNVSVIKNKLINLEKPWLTYLGVISYGLYMYHMLIDYLLRLVTEKVISKHVPGFLIIPLYYILLIFGTILIAAISHKYFEKYFLNLKNRLHKQ
jgi:peptidoglycan/LPS O-acetylase OafA/YrhL